MAVSSVCDAMFLNHELEPRDNTGPGLMVGSRPQNQRKDSERAERLQVSEVLGVMVITELESPTSSFLTDS